MRLLMLATGPFAVPTFKSLYDTRHSVVGLVTAPIRMHRGRPVPPISSIRDVAAGHGTPIFDPEDVNTAESQSRLAQSEADLLITCDYGQILKPATLATARRGGVNLHGSLLPKYRGAAPINWAILNGDAETGVTVIHMTPQIDAGPCIAQAKTAIGPEETSAELEIRLSELGAGLICEAIELLDSGQAKILPQDSSLAGKAPRLKKTDGEIDWNRPAEAIRNQIRALEPWPRTYTFWHPPGGEPVRVILGPASATDSPAGEFSPGTVIEAAGGRLVIAAGRGTVLPRTIQPAGKRAMAIEEFLRGHRVTVGDRFGPET